MSQTIRFGLFGSGRGQLLSEWLGGASSGAIHFFGARPNGGLFCSSFACHNKFLN
jgi:hypothetical protein